MCENVVLRFAEKSQTFAVGVPGLVLVNGALWICKYHYSARTRGVKSSFPLTGLFFLLLWEITWLDSLEQLFSTILVICFSNYPDIKWLFLMISAWEHLEFVKTPIISGFPSTSFTSCHPLFGLKINFSPNMVMFLNLEIWQVLNSEGTGMHAEERVLIILHESWLFSKSCPSSNNSKGKDHLSCS